MQVKVVVEHMWYKQPPSQCGVKASSQGLCMPCLHPRATFKQIAKITPDCMGMLVIHQLLYVLRQYKYSPGITDVPVIPVPNVLPDACEHAFLHALL